MINWPIDRSPKKNSFVLTSTDVGTMIVNKNDYKNTVNGDIGVGYELLNFSSFDASQVNILMQILLLLRQYRGDGVVMLDEIGRAHV